jgi:hypothetical protein
LGLQFLFSEEGLYLRRQILLALTEDDRLHTDEVQRIWGLVKDDFKPQELVNVAWNAVREFSLAGVSTILPQR